MATQPQKTKKPRIEAAASFKATVHTASIKAAVSALDTVFRRVISTPDIHVRLAVGHDKFWVEAASSGIYLKLSFEAQNTESIKAACYLPLRTFSTFSLPGTSVDLSYDGKRLNYVTGRMKGQLNCMKPEDDVARITSRATPAIVLPPKTFTNLSESVLFKPSVTDMPLRLHLRTSAEAGTLLATCADEYRVARFRASQAEDGIEILGDLDYVFSGHTLQKIKGLFKGQVKIATDGKSVRLESEGIELYIPATAEETNPNLDAKLEQIQAIAEQVVFQFRLAEADGIIRPMCTVGQVASEGRLKLVRHGSDLVASVSGDDGSAECRFMVKSKGDKTMQVVVSAPYFLEFLKAARPFTEDLVTMHCRANSVSLVSGGAAYIMPVYQA